MKGLLEQAGIEDPRAAVPPPGVGPGAAPTTSPTVPGATPPPATSSGAVPPAAEARVAPGEPNKQEIDIFVANALKLVHNPTVSDKIIGQVADAKDPIPVVADVTLQIVDRLETSAKGAGKPVSLTTVAYGSNVIMGEIITSAEAAGMKKMDDKSKYQAYSLAVAKYLDESVKSGKMTKDELAQMGKEAEASPAGQKMADYAMKQGNAGTAPPVESPAAPPMGGTPVMGG